MLETGEVPAALQDAPVLAVFVKGRGLVGTLTLAGAGRPVRSVRVVVRPRDDSHPSGWSVSALSRVPLARSRAPGVVEVGPESVVVRWGGRRARSLVDKVTMPSASAPNLLIVDLFDRHERVIGHSAVELRALPDEETYQDLCAYAARSQSGADPGPLIGLVRFFRPLEAVADLVPGARVFVSGCGTGGELAVLAQMGAAEVVGSEVSGPVLDLARRLTQGNPRITVVSTQEAERMRDRFDLTISRHVVEHLAGPTDQRRYLAHLVESVRVGGQVVVEFPNQDCPIEPHTGLEFFHWLDAAQRRQVVEYLTLRSSVGCYPEEQVEALRRLGEHRNVSLPEFRSWLPANGDLVQVRYVDDAFESDHPLASTISGHITRTS